MDEDDVQISFGKKMIEMSDFTNPDNKLFINSKC
jgi:hypothetical protein